MKMPHKEWRQALALTLVVLQLTQPLSRAAYAAGVAPTTAGTTLDQAANGVPIVNIAAPGAAGVSHNSYAQFDVGSNGLIFNNSAQPVNTQLGGFIPGNAHMGSGAARLILNEVTSANPSQLSGYMEVAGQKAGVIVANPYGITCRGCGFINTSKATLSTGTPFFSGDGSVGGFNVENGTLRIEGDGLNASNTERLALYSRVLELNAALHARNLQVVTGSNHINAVTGAVTAFSATSPAPAYAIDSSALGGMYANTISLLGTEAGVGMRLAGPVAALTGKLEILNNGDVRLARSSAQQQLSINAQGSLSLGDNASAGGQATLTAGTTLNLEDSALLTGQNMQLDAAVINTAAGTAIAARGNLQVNAGEQRYAGNIGSGSAMLLNGRNISTGQQLAVGSGLGVNAETFQNSGRMDVADGAVAINLAGVFNNSGAVKHGGSTFTLNAAGLGNASATLASEGLLTVQLSGSSVLDNRNGLLQGNGGLQLQSAGLSSGSGQILSNGTINLDLRGAALDNRSGLIETAGSITLNNGGNLQNDNGILRAGQDLSLYLPGFDNSQSRGLYAAGGLLALHTSGDILFSGTEFKTPGALLLDAGTASIRIDSRVETGADGVLRGQNVFLGDNGFLASQGRLDTSSVNLVNLGILYGRNGVGLHVENALDNGEAGIYRAAAILSEGDIRISTVADGRLQIVNNHGGIVESLGGNIDIRAENLNNINVGWSIAAPATQASTFAYSIDQNSFDSFHYCCGRSGEDVVSSRTETQIIRHDFASFGHAAQIIAGRDITLNLDELLNDHSSISAGGILDVTARRITNTGTTLTDEIIKRRIDHWHTCEYDDWGDLDCWRVSRGPYVSSFDGEQESLPGILEGRAGVNLHGTLVNGEPARTGNTVGSNAGVFAGLNLNPGDIPPPGNLNIGILDPTALPGFNLPGNGIYHLNQNPAHPYLIETDPALNTYGGFLGSAYLIDHLNWQPGITQRRLGDSYYEITLIREALLASLGSRFLDPAIADEKAQYEYLMQNAIAASESLHLSAGISLSREQIDALQQDIVWMEERRIGSEKVLVPVVYLAQGSSRILHNGAVIGGGSISISGDSFSNAGLVRARDSIQVGATGDIANRGGRLEAGGDLRLQSGSDILNESGQLSGGNVYLQAEGDISHSTRVQRDAAGSGNTESWSIRAGDEARVTATGNLVQTAGGDIRLQAAALSGNNVALVAGNNIVMDTVQTGQGYRYDSADWQQVEEHVRYLTTQVEAAQNLSLSAGADITAIAASLRAGGDAVLDAGRSINFLAVEENDHLEAHSQHDGTFSDKSFDLVDDEVRTVGSRIDAGGDLVLRAGRDITLYASTAVAEGRGDISAGGNINLIAGVNTTSHSEQSSKEGVATFRNNQQGHIEQTAVASGIASGSDLNLHAGADVNLVASVLHSAATLRIGDTEMEQAGAALHSAGGKPVNLNVGTLELTNEAWNETRKGLKGPLAELVKVIAVIAEPMVSVFSAGQLEMPEITIGEHNGTRSKDVLQAGSTLSAQDMLIRVQDTAAFVGTDIAAQGTVAVSARDIVIDAAAETSTYRHEEGKDTVKGLGAKLGKDEVRVAGVEETKTSSSDTQTVTQWRGSSINAGQLILQAENNIDVLGSQLNVVEDAVIKAGGDLTISGREGNITQEHKETTEVVTVAAAVRNAYVDAVLAIKGIDDAKDALKDARRALDEAEHKVGLGQLDAGDLDYFKANMAAAAANLAQATIAAATSLAAAAVIASSTAGTGFYVSGSAMRDKTTTTSTSTQSVWQGSDLKVGGSAVLVAGDTLKVQGSNVAVSNTLILDANKIELVAGAERSTQKSKTTEEHEGASVSVSPASVTANVNASYRDTDADSSSLHYVNTHIAAGALGSRSDSLRVAGAQLLAADVDIETSTLTVASLQDEAHSKTRTRGASAGIGIGSGGVTSVSAGMEKSDGASDSFWVSEQTQIIGSNSIRIRAQDTTISGAVIANAAQTEEGQFVDKGRLDFQTGTLAINDLQDVSKSKTTGFSFSTSINTSAFKPGEAGQSPTGQTSIGAQYYGHETQQVTRATLGSGNVLVSGQAADAGNAAGLNRDLSRAQEITVDKDIGGLNASVSIDNRWLTAEGRDSIGNDVGNSGKNLQIVSNGLEKDIQMISTDAAPRSVADALLKADKYSLGILPFDSADNGGLLAAIPVMLGASDVSGGVRQLRTADDPQVQANPDHYMPAENLPGYADLSPEGQMQLQGRMVSKDFVAITTENSTYRNATNGMMNTPAEAMVNAIEQTGGVKVTQNYNPRHGFLADILEIGTDKVGIALMDASRAVSEKTGITVDIGFMSGAAAQTGMFMRDVMAAQGTKGASFSNHSQANILTLAGLELLHSNDYAGSNLRDSNDNSIFQFVSYGSPVPNQVMNTALKATNLTYAASVSNPGDFVAEGLGGNSGTWILSGNNEDFTKNTINIPGRINRIGNARLLLTGDKYPVLDPATGKQTNVLSPHSGYQCIASCDKKD